MYTVCQGPNRGGKAAPLADVAGHVGQRIEKAVVTDQLATAGFGQQVTDTFELKASDVHTGERFSLRSGSVF